MICLFLSMGAQCQAPAGFRWINFKQDAPTVLKIEEALKSEDYSAIREIGILGDFALVMTSRREVDQPTPVGDEWQVYNISSQTWNVTPVIFGYNLEIKDWINFQSEAIPDLGLVYVDCWECEPTAMFTALHYEQQNGWRARWVNKENSKQPGIVLGVTDVGDPYTNEDVNQVFAVLGPLKGMAIVGTWYHSRDLGSGKVTDIVSKFLVDPVTRQDKSEVVHGRDAASWEMRLCKASDALDGLLGGQDSPVCKVLKQQPK
ncbi:MAG: hypothetical protein ACRD3P_00350 [Terriglobales bacterium]